MIPTPALRETIILIIFGIVLVPIAAKRAQYAPIRWPTFAAELSSLAASRDDTSLPSWGGAGGLTPRMNETVALRQQQRQPRGEKQQQQGEAFSPYATNSAARTETSAPLTIRFQIATRERADAIITATAAGSSEAAATATVAPAAAAAAAPPAVVKASEASKGRWTLIWMCSAIAAVAVFMSSC